MTTDQADVSSKFERFLFGFTRLFAVVGSVLALVFIVLLAFNFAGLNNTKHITLADLQAQTGKNLSGADNNNVADSPLPKAIQRHISGSNAQVLDKWLAPLNSEQRADFIDNMASIIEEAEKQKVDVVAAVNDYSTVKLKNFDRAPFERYEKLAQRTALVSGIAGLVLFIVLMSLMLVALAIERNTRRS